MIITHPTLVRIRLFSESPSGGAAVWASTYPPDTALTPEPADLSRTPTTYGATVAGQPVIAVVIPTPEAGSTMASVGLYFSLTERDAELSQLTRRLVAESGIITLFDLLALTVAVYLVVIRRVKRLDRNAVSVAQGDTSMHLPEGDEPRGRDELVNVAHEFDHMVAAVRQRISKEREDAQKLREPRCREERAPARGLS